VPASREAQLIPVGRLAKSNPRAIGKPTGRERNDTRLQAFAGRLAAGRATPRPATVEILAPPPVL